MWLVTEHCPQVAKRLYCGCTSYLSLLVQNSHSYPSIVFAKEEYKTNLVHKETKAQATIYDPLLYLHRPHYFKT